VPGRFARLILFGLIGLAVWAAGAQAMQPTACLVERRAELPVTLLRNFLLVPVSLDGRKVLMVVDTGAEATTLTPEAATSLGLASAPSDTVVVGASGRLRAGSLRLRRMELGGIERRGVAVDVGAMPLLAIAGRKVAGLLGIDALGGYDIEIDLPHHLLRLYSAPPCPGFVPPGFRAGEGHALRRAGGGLITLSVRVDGQAVRALLDTGARSTLVTRRVAAGLGVTDDDLSRDPLVTGRGIGTGSVAFRRHRFDEVRVGDIAVRDMQVNVAALPFAGIDMLLGADWLAGRRVWISPAGGRLYQR
jgi:clan AA aspartic protease (TIGR02281 family)